MIVRVGSVFSLCALDSFSYQLCVANYVRYNVVTRIRKECGVSRHRLLLWLLAYLEMYFFFLATQFT